MRAQIGYIPPGIHGVARAEKRPFAPLLHVWRSVSAEISPRASTMGSILLALLSITILEEDGTWHLLLNEYVLCRSNQDDESIPGFLRFLPVL
jgi:hypothetical protein